MAKRPTRDLTVGVVFALALVILALAVMTVGGELPGVSKKTTYKAVFPHADGLMLGAPVRMAGVQIGNVTRIRLPTDPRQSGIEVQIAIDPTFAVRIREDSTVGLRILQLLTNEKYVEVFPGSPDRAQLAPGSTLPVLGEPGVLEQGEAIAENAIEITGALRRMLEQLESQKGLLGRVIYDPEFGVEGLEALRGTLENMEQLTHQMVAGRGVAGRLLQDEALAQRLDRLAEAVDELAALAQAIREGRGVLGDLIEDGGTGQLALEDVRAAASSFRRIAERLESDQSLLGQLMREPECANRLPENLCATLENLAQVTGKINRGQGTLGALVNERSLHDSAEEVVSGASDSKMTRWLLRRYRKQGIKAREREQGAEEQGPAQEDQEPPEAEDD